MMPLALYFLFLAYLNQRSQSTLMSGMWDFGCALLGLSGFILVSGPLFLALLDARWRGNLFTQNLNQLKAAWAISGFFWSCIVAAYFLAVIAGIAFVVFLRKRFTVIYNCDRRFVEETLIAALEALGLSWRRVVGGFEINQRVLRQIPKSTEETAKRADNPLSSAKHAAAFVQIDSFASLHYASLRWRDVDPLVRRGVEGELEKLFEVAETPPNPAAGWFMTAAVAIFLVMLLWMIFLIYQMMAGK